MEKRTEPGDGTPGQTPPAEPQWPTYAAGGITGGAFSLALIHLHQTETFTTITFMASLAGAIVLGGGLEVLFRRLAGRNRRVGIPPAA